MIQTPFTQPESASSLKRSPRIENSTIRYATKANEMKMNHTMSPNDMTCPSLAVEPMVISLLTWSGTTSSRADELTRQPADQDVAHDPLVDAVLQIAVGAVVER